MRDNDLIEKILTGGVAGFLLGTAGVIAGKLVTAGAGLFVAAGTAATIGIVAGAAVAVVPALAVWFMFAADWSGANNDMKSGPLALSMFATGALTASLLTGYVPGRETSPPPVTPVSTEFNKEACTPRLITIEEKTYTAVPEGCPPVTINTP